MSQTKVIQIGGMWCASCAQAIERMLKRQTGMHSAEVSFAAQTALIEWDTQQLDLEEIIQKVEKAGYRASLNLLNSDDVLQEQNQQHALWVERYLKLNAKARLLLALALIPVGLMPMVGHSFGIAPLIGEVSLTLAALASLITVFICGSSILAMAWRNLKAGQWVMDSMVSMGGLIAIGLSFYLWGQHGYFDVAQMLFALLLLARHIEAHLRGKAHAAVAALSDHSKRNILVEREGAWVEDRVSNIAVAELIVIRPADEIPLDVIVEKGESYVNEATYTGEAIPVHVKPGSLLRSGSINLYGELKARVKHAFGQREMDRIALALHRSITQSSRVIPLADLLSRWMIPVIAVLAIASTLFLYIQTGNAVLAIERGLTVLILSCPCAIALAEPLSLLRMAAFLSKKGITLVNPQVIFRLKGLLRFVFDKTGTLTEALLKITQTLPQPFISAQSLGMIASNLSQHNPHPLASAIRSYYPTTTTHESELVVLPGSGSEKQLSEASLTVLLNQDYDKLAALLEHTPSKSTPRLWTARMGKLSWLRSLQVDIPQNLPETTHSNVHLAIDHVYLGAIEFADTPRAGIGDMLNALRSLGEIYILSGDKNQTVQNFAQQVGVVAHHALGELSPEAKSTQIQLLKQQGKVIYMGDGLNDALAMANASIAIAIDHTAQTTRHTAQLLIPAQQVTLLPQLIKRLQSVKQLIWQNTAIALGVVVPSVILAILGVLTPLYATFIMISGPLLVFANTWRFSFDIK